jgi:hypothetical protein
MQEATITINGTLLNDAEAETLGVAVDMFANVLAEGLARGDEGITQAATVRYLSALARIQKLLLGGPPGLVQ